MNTPNEFGIFEQFEGVYTQFEILKAKTHLPEDTLIKKIYLKTDKQGEIKLEMGGGIIHWLKRLCNRKAYIINESSKTAKILNELAENSKYYEEDKLGTYTKQTHVKAGCDRLNQVLSAICNKKQKHHTSQKEAITTLFNKFVCTFVHKSAQAVVESMPQATKPSRLEPASTPEPVVVSPKPAKPARSDDVPTELPTSNQLLEPKVAIKQHLFDNFSSGLKEVKQKLDLIKMMHPLEKARADPAPTATRAAIAKLQKQANVIIDQLDKACQGLEVNTMKDVARLRNDKEAIDKLAAELTHTAVPEADAMRTQHKYKEIFSAFGVVDPSSMMNLKERLEGEFFKADSKWLGWRSTEYGVTGSLNRGSYLKVRSELKNILDTKTAPDLERLGKLLVYAKAQLGAQKGDVRSQKMVYQMMLHDFVRKAEYFLQAQGTSDNKTINRLYTILGIAHDENYLFSLEEFDRESFESLNLKTQKLQLLLHVADWSHTWTKPIHNDAFETQPLTSLLTELQVFKNR